MVTSCIVGAQEQFSYPWQLILDLAKISFYQGVHTIPLLLTLINGMDKAVNLEKKLRLVRNFEAKVKKDKVTNLYHEKKFDDTTGHSKTTSAVVEN